MSVKLERYELVQHGRVLATRSVGRDVGRRIAERLAEEHALLLSFYGVEVASPSFLFELISAVRTALIAQPQRWVLVTGMNEDVLESAELVLDRLKMTLGTLDHGQIKLLGGSQHLQDTIRAAQKLGTFTAPDLAEQLKIKLPALHQRLNQLIKAGVLTREDDPTATRGKRGQYSAPPTTADDLEDQQDTGEFTALTVGG
jgi:Mn-dependent DtxR family transcriptional regulator